ncbi:uncharacterized protein LOC133388781 isoform X2 [Rhineura floridana]|uniref:uncharacterized protein LOC133388781 isoform X2 n=1 Tax=Rhineura floridana TaxID=261503 RepID=UPI002AC8262B|nr:uncharacterized protein LOC133388781 isoform X2 [Rhineura floridana]
MGGSMANPSKTPIKTPGRHSSLTSEGSLGQVSCSHCRPGICPSRGSLLRKQVSGTSLHPERQARAAQPAMPRCRRSESVPEPDPVLVFLVQAMAQTGIPLSEAEFFEGIVVRPLGVRQSLPSVVQLHGNVLPALGRRHESALQHAVRNRDAFVFLHEATAGDGRAALGISLLPLDRVGQSPLLLGIEFLKQLSQASVARAVAHVLNKGHVLFHRVLAVVTPGNAHMIQAFVDSGILGALLPAALHVPCLLHQLELVMELWPARLEKMAMVLRLLQDAFGRWAALRHRYQLFLQERELELSLPLPSMWTGPEAWLEKAIGLAKHLPVLMEFVAAGEEEGATMAMLQKLLGESSQELVAEATFVVEHGMVLLSMAQFLHKTGEPLAHRVYAELDALHIALSYHVDMGFGPNTRSQLALCQPHLAEQFHGILACSLTRLKHLLNSHPAMPTLRAVRALDPKQVGAVGWGRLQHEQGIPGLAEVPEVEWFRYQHLAEAAPANVCLPQWWEAQAEQLPMLSTLAQRYLWLPVCLPSSPFLPGDILSLTDAEEGLTDESVRLWRMLRYNRNLC